MNRREMLKVSLLTGGAVLLSGEGKRAIADADRHTTGAPIEPRSPAVKNPFTVKLPRMPRKEAFKREDDLLRAENGGVKPNGTVYPQLSGNDALATYLGTLERIAAAQQYNSGSNTQFRPGLWYVLDVKQKTDHMFHTDPPYNKGSTIWGYDGKYPGPTFISRYGVPILVRIINRLYDDKDANLQEGTVKKVAPDTNFGDPRITTHLHNGHSASESDGNPFDRYPLEDPRYPEAIRALRFRDHHYAMFRPGLDPSRPANMPVPNVKDGDSLETVSTLWYHDHSEDFTAANVYKGLAGFHLFFDEVDSDNENDTSTCALRLPSGDFDIPLLFQDKRFNADGQMTLPTLNQNNDGFLGDTFVVNGVIQPKLKVQRRKYRFRLLNAGPSRFYQFFLTKTEKGTKTEVDQVFTYIGNDESLLEKPLRKEKSVLLSVAERADVVIDFKCYKPGEMLVLVNRLVMNEAGIGPEFVDNTFKEMVVLPAGQGDRVLCFEVEGDVVEDPSRVPDKLRKSPDLPSDLHKLLKAEKPAEKLKNLPNHMCFEFQKLSGSGFWVINGQKFDADSIRKIIRPVPDPSDPAKLIDGYVWTIKNEGDSDWSHPVHIHLEEFRILLRNGDPPPATESCRKDVLLLRPREEVQIFLRFRDFLGKYPIHCHNVLHEDHSMMMRYDVLQ